MILVPTINDQHLEILHLNLCISNALHPGDYLLYLASAMNIEMEVIKNKYLHPHC